MIRLAVARQDSSPADGASAGLDPGELARARALAPPARAAFAASRRLLRGLLEAVTGVPGRDWTIDASPGTAPRARLADGRPGPAVSLSHRLGWVAAAVSQAGAVGIDLECARPSRSDPAERAALMLCADELSAWLALPEAAREAALLDAWVAKEARFKAAPAGEVPWDFRRLHVRTCASAQANVRGWRAGPLFVALSCAEAGALAAAACEGWPEAAAVESFWRVDHVS